MRIEDNYGNIVSLDKAIEEILDGSDYENGELETIRDQLDNVTKVLAKLIVKTVDMSQLEELLSDCQKSYRYKFNGEVQNDKV